MAGRTALSIAVAAVAIALASCGGGSWSCSWQCSSNETSGTATYPSGPDPTDQCATDHGADCNAFSCNCTQ